MIRPIDSEDYIVKTLRELIISQLELKPNQVLNSLSFRGADLHKEVENFTYKTFSQNNLVIIFELLENDSTNNITYTDNENNIILYASYKFDLTIYGKDSGIYSKKLRARFLTDEVLEELEQKGIRLYDIDYPSSGTEFINDVIWERKDMSIYLSVRIDTTKILINEEFERADDLTVIKI